MRKPTWWDLGIAVLGLVLVCSATQGGPQAQYPAEGSVGDVTQDSRVTGTSDGMGSDQGLTTGATAPQTDTDTDTGGSGTGQGTETGQATDTGQATGGTQQQSQVEAQQRVEIARLRAQVAGLEQQLAQMRVELARARAATQGVGGSGQGVGGSGQGVGGSGTAGIGDPNAEAPEGATGIGYATSEGVGGSGQGAVGTSAEGVAVANVIHTGRVRSVTQQRLVLDEEGGGTSTLSLARDVRITRDGQQVALRNLSEGTLVRTSADLYARGNPVTSIEVLSAPEKRSK